MKNQNKRNIFFSLIIIGMLSTTLMSYLWNIKEIEQNINDVIKNQARAFFSELITTRAWNAGHGGVYVPVSDKIKPNPYLDVPNRDVYTTDSILLTKVNPAFMTRLIAEIAQKEDGIKYHITSIKPIRPKNSADKWETKSLESFENGNEESFEYFEADTMYRYMAPLPVTQACMACHAKQGYKIGDVRGGISITIPADNFIEALNKQKIIILYIHILVLLIFSVIFIIFINLLNKQFKKIREKNALLIEQKEELFAKSSELAEANDEILIVNESLNQQKEDLIVNSTKLSDANEKITLANETLKLQKAELIVKSIENSEINEEISKANESLIEQKIIIETSLNNLRLLSNIGKQIISVLTIKDIISKAHKSIEKLMNISFFAIGIYSKENNRIDFPATIKDNVLLSNYYYSMTKKDSFSVWCLTNKKEIFINDLDNEYSKYLSKYPNLKNFKAQSFLYCPLFIKEKIIGTVTVQHQSKNAFTEFNLFALRNIAVYISIALENADSYKLIKNQMNEINLKNSVLESSIKYAQSIQQSMFPSISVLKEKYNTDVFFKPRDIVSGDFYWTEELINEHSGSKMQFIAAVDCTGHGVPGAFLSFLGYKSLNEIVYNKEYSPKKILYYLDLKVKKVLHQETSNNLDGMDISLCKIEEINENTKKITFAGAKLPMFHFHAKENKVEYIKGSIKTIGGRYTKNHEYVEKELFAKKGDYIYLATDGYIDQNSTTNKRLGRLKFALILKEISSYGISVQKEILNKIFLKFLEDAPQRDDVTVVIIKI